MSASEKLRALDGTATPGPWEIVTFGFAVIGHDANGEHVPTRFGGDDPPHPDVVLVEALRNALPLLADVVEAAERQEPLACPTNCGCEAPCMDAALTALREHLEGQ